MQYVEEPAEGLHMRHRRCSMIYSTQHSPVNILLQACAQFSHILPRQDAAVSAVRDAAGGPFIQICMERLLLLLDAANRWTGCTLTVGVLCHRQRFTCSRHCNAELISRLQRLHCS